uniref:SWIM-type domain-containing protein n=1 Tax=Romanomermis culicivorax TaxID=13658 RepID=A0A915L8U8_ROMCU
MPKRETIEPGKILQYCRFGQVCVQLPKQCFNVTENGKDYLVRFNPTSCSCGDKACAHLIATRLSCNLPVMVKANRNITTLRPADK